MGGQRAFHLLPDRAEEASLVVRQEVWPQDRSLHRGLLMLSDSDFYEALTTLQPATFPAAFYAAAFDDTALASVAAADPPAARVQVRHASTSSQAPPATEESLSL